ncbi:MAG: glutathione S-transferase [Porticoccaceae bacterium]|nr:glutathione S-transferase [Porticoccaceae bacterium]
MLSKGRDLYPLLYSFRRCPYAMRARMALYQAGVQCELVEVELKAKPATMLLLSPKGSVPVLQLPSGEVLDESLDIMHWALAQNDPEAWLPTSFRLSQSLIDENDGSFKAALDRYKYPQRFPGGDSAEARDRGMDFLYQLNVQLNDNAYLLGSQVSFVDIATFPFVRQFANTDGLWFETQALSAVRRWLGSLVNSDLFLIIMAKNRSHLL